MPASLPSITGSIRAWARRVKRDVLMLWFARKHPDTPRLALVVCALAVAYALSPIDLIPDFIPVLGYLDDAILLPAMIWLAVRLLPPHVVTDCRARAVDWMAQQKGYPTSRAGAVAIVFVWLAFTASCTWLFWR